MFSAVLRDVSFALYFQFPPACCYGARTLFADKARQISTVIVEPAILIRTEMISSFDSFTFKKAKV